MNKKGQRGAVGMVFVLIGAIFLITAFGLIPVFKEMLDDARDTTSLNCRGTDNFNSTAFAEDEGNTIKELTRRPTCFFTGMGLIYFIGSFLLAVIVWVAAKWSKLK